MVRADTAGIVATMQDTQLLWDSAIVQLVRNAMGKLNVIRFLVNAQHAIALVVSGGSPDPTRVGLSDLCPETISEGRGFACATARATTELPASSEVGRSFDGEGFAAFLANHVNATWKCVMMVLHSDLNSGCHASGISHYPLGHHYAHLWLQYTTVQA